MRFDRLDLNLLVALDVLLETQSVTLAARKLNLSQPSVSAALSRLRDYFGDELLIPVGRKMVATARAEELWPAVKEMLNIVRFKITNADEYVPATSRRRFRIIASDYVYDVLVAKVLAKAETLSPFATFDISTPGPRRSRQFLDGDIDVMITVTHFAIEGHPTKALFSDRESVICWNKGKFARGVTAEQFRTARHAVAVFGQEQMPTITELHFAAEKVEQAVALRVPNFAALPGAVVGTDRIATMHSLHAQLLSAVYPIAVHPLPVDGPVVAEVMQWHKLRQNDAGLQWLLGQIEGEAQKLVQ